MDWISFFWGIGALLFVNIVYGIWFYPKQLKEINEIQRRNSERISALKDKLEVVISKHEEGLVSLQKHRDKVLSSLKLMKSCPACGAEFPLYVLEEEKVNG